MTSCPVCESIQNRRIFTRFKSDFLRCYRCGLIFAGKSPAGPDFSDQYSREYYSPWGRTFEEVARTRENKQTNFSEWLKFLTEFISPGRILDAGCAMGFFLDIARNAGWDTFGIEISKFASSQARLRFGAKVKTGNFLENDFEPEFFDAVTMFDFLEHSSDPVSMLLEANRLLRKGGILMLSTPNAHALSRILMGKFWPHFKVEHPICFSPKSLEKAFCKTGFKSLKTSPAKKTVSFSTVAGHFEKFTIPVLSKIVALTYSVLPEKISGFPIRLCFGEMLAVARKLE